LEMVPQNPIGGSDRLHWHRFQGEAKSFLCGMLGKPCSALLRVALLGCNLHHIPKLGLSCFAAGDWCSFCFGGEPLAANSDAADGELDSNRGITGGGSWASEGLYNMTLPIQPGPFASTPCARKILAHASMLPTTVSTTVSTHICARQGTRCWHGSWVSGGTTKRRS
jgi:hypothetical protein